MGPFSASLRVAGDSSALPATLTVDNGRISIRAGDQPIGDWSLKEIDLSRTEAGYRMKAEGEQIFLSFTDIAAFDAAVGQVSKKNKKKRSGRARGSATAKSPQTTGKPDESSFQRFVTMVDNSIERAERRFGDLLPDWVFTRLMAIGLFLALLVTIFKPGLVSTLLLISGLGIVVFGAVLYTDDRLSTKLLPGRSRPTHVLITGVGVLLIGVLLGVVAG